MKVTIYEEYPQEENLGKLESLNGPLNLVVASPNLLYFCEIKDKVKKTYRNVERVGYWPTLEMCEGYWMSPFSKNEGLDRVIGELENRDRQDKLLLTWDAELPILTRSRLMFSEAGNFRTNKKQIIGFLQRHKELGIDLECAELPGIMVPEGLQRLLGISFDPKVYDSVQVKMFYTNFLRGPLEKVFSRKKVDFIIKNLLAREIESRVRKYGEKFSIGIGSLAYGTGFSKEGFRDLKPEELASDLTTAREAGASRVHIYRLGGLNPESIQVINEFCKS